MQWRVFTRHLRTISIASSLGLVAFVLACAGPAHGQAPQVPAQPSAPATAAYAAPQGTASLFGLDDGGSLSTNSTALSLAVNGGAQWSRVEVSWATVEPTQTSDLANSQFFKVPALETLLAGGLSPIVYISDIPSWAKVHPNDPGCGPIDTGDAGKMQAFADFMTALVTKYPAVKVWALYNEVDNTTTGGAGCFGGSDVNNNNKSDIKEYAAMLAAAHAGITKANTALGTNALLGSGAIAYDNFTPATCPPKYPSCAGGIFNYNFLPNLLNFIKQNPLAPGAKYMDVMLFNYYDIYGAPYWNKIAKGKGIQAKANAIRTQLTKAGLPLLDLYVTETGEPSTTDWIGTAGQARCLGIVMARGAAANLKSIVWWTFQDFPDSAKPPMNTWKYGVVDQNLAPKLSYNTFKTYSTELDGFAFSKNVSSKPTFADIEAYRFTNGTTNKFFVLSTAYKTTTSYKSECSWARNVRVATFKAKSVRVVDYQGNPTIVTDGSPQDKNPVKGKIGIRVGANPLLVELNPAP